MVFFWIQMQHTDWTAQFSSFCNGDGNLGFESGGEEDVSAEWLAKQSSSVWHLMAGCSGV